MSQLWKNLTKQKAALMLAYSFVETSRKFIIAKLSIRKLGSSSVLILSEFYVKMSEILNSWLSLLISQVPPYLMFILVSKSTHPVSLVLSSQTHNAFTYPLH